MDRLTSAKTRDDLPAGSSHREGQVGTSAEAVTLVELGTALAYRAYRKTGALAKRQRSKINSPAYPSFMTSNVHKRPNATTGLASSKSQLTTSIDKNPQWTTKQDPQTSGSGFESLAATGSHSGRPLGQVSARWCLSLQYRAEALDRRGTSRPRLTTLSSATQNISEMASESSFYELTDSALWMMRQQ
jgi:hypothetical protein